MAISGVFKSSALGNTQRGIMAAQHAVGLLAKPRRMPELESKTQLLYTCGGCILEKGLKPVRIGLETRRQLKKDQAHASGGEHRRQGGIEESKRIGTVLQSHEMRDPLGRFE